MDYSLHAAERRRTRDNMHGVMLVNEDGDLLESSLPPLARR
jgi:hypothetical protein